MKLSLYQGPAEPRDTIAAMEEAARAAAAQGAELLLFPELFLTGYNIGAPAISRAAQPRDGAAAQAAAEIAARHRIALVYGYPERDGDRVFNAAMFIDSTGTPCAHYRKTQLFGDVDRAIFTPGEDPAVLTTYGGLRLGFLICYDVEFPELVRGLALRGADLILVPTAQMEPYAFVARSMIPTRAYENSLFIAYANRCGVEADFTYTGESCIAGPDGACLARAGAGEALITATLEPGALAEARRLNTYLADRRPALYGELTR